MNEVHHCYDFGTVLITIGDTLSNQVKSEMVRFFREELQTPMWMRALSTRDLDVTFSIRPDHQWTGAYTAWPSLALSALFVAGEGDVAFKWIKGLAETARQGPIAQAHFAETAVAPEAGGGARKAPSDQPYINDWACVSGCAYLEPVSKTSSEFARVCLERLRRNRHLVSSMQTQNYETLTIRVRRIWLQSRELNQPEQVVTAKCCRGGHGGPPLQSE